MTQPTEPTAAQEQAQADADLAHAVAEEKLADDLAARDAENAAVAEDEAALAQNPQTAPEPPADQQGAAPTTGETADSPNVSSPVAQPAPVTNGLADGDTSGGGGVPTTEPSSNAPTDVVTPGDTGAEQPATAAPFDPSSGTGANAGASVTPGQAPPASAPAATDSAPASADQPAASE